MSVLRGPSQHDGLAVARGLVGGAYQYSSYGELLTAGTARTNQLVWPLDGVALPVPDEAGVTVTVTSTSDQDAAGGTGIQAMHIHYLDGNLASQSLLVVPTGTTPKVTTITDCRFIQCVHGTVFGSGREAAGNISMTGGGLTLSYIAAGFRRCSSSARRVPAGKRMIIKSLWGSSISGTSAVKSEIRLVTTSIEGHDLTESGITFPHMSVGEQDGAVTLSGLSFPVSEGVIACLECDTENKVTKISAGFLGWLEDA